MLILWRVRFVNPSTRTFHNRDLYVDTKTLDTATRIALEYLAQTRNHQQARKIVEFRKLFKEGDWLELTKDIDGSEVPRWIGSIDYFEDQNGQPISERELGQVVTGNPHVVPLPSGAKPHDIELIRSNPEPLPLENVSLSEKDVRTLAYFVRDLKELEETELRKDGPGLIKSVGTLPSPKLCDPVLETGVTDDEIRSAVIIFRRFIMKDEPANFNKAVDVFVAALSPHPYAKWVDGIRNEFNSSLETPPDMLPFSQLEQFTFTTKELIEVFLYTQYAHQPDARRERQYAECLKQVNGRRNFLTWLFLTELWASSLKITSAGRTIGSWFKKYCVVNNIAPEVLVSLRDDHKGIGAIEKKDVEEKRLLESKVAELAKELWDQNGCPEEGFEAFLDLARQKLSDFT